MQLVAGQTDGFEWSLSKKINGNDLSVTWCNLSWHERTVSIRHILDRFWEKSNAVTHVLNHGDITMDNLLWSNGRIVSLIDFEHSVIAPSELDLHSIINMAFFNDYNLHSDKNIKEFRQYKKDIIELFRPLLTNSYSTDLILGYAVLFRMRFLEMWLDNPNGRLDQFDAYIKLLSLADGEGGYLSEILNKL